MLFRLKSYFKHRPLKLALVFTDFSDFFTDPLAFNGLNPEGTEDCDIEQHITIIPNPRAKRRGSMADHAFPELHGSRAGKKARVHIVCFTFTHHLTSDRHLLSICFLHCYRREKIY